MARFLHEANTEMLRRVLDDVFTDPRFINQTSVSAFEVAEHIWKQAAIGERDSHQIKHSAFAKLNPNGVTPSFPSNT